MWGPLNSGGRPYFSWEKTGDLFLVITARVSSVSCPEKLATFFCHRCRRVAFIHFFTRSLECRPLFPACQKFAAPLVGAPLCWAPVRLKMLNMSKSAAAEKSENCSCRCDIVVYDRLLSRESCSGGCVHLRPVSRRSGVGPAFGPVDGVAQQGALLGAAGRPHVRDPDGSARSQVLPVSGLQEAEPHRPQLHHVPAAAHHAEPRPLDSAWCRRSLRHQIMTPCQPSDCRHRTDREFLTGMFNSMPSLWQLRIHEKI